MINVEDVPCGTEYDRCGGCDTYDTGLNVVNMRSTECGQLNVVNMRSMGGVVFRIDLRIRSC
jgi:hypothetical protein